MYRALAVALFLSFSLFATLSAAAQTTFSVHPYATDSDNKLVTQADFNGDGVPDIVTRVYDGYNSARWGYDLHLSNGDGTFQAPQHLLIGGMFPFGAITEDFNRDGKVDLIYSQGTNPLLFLAGNGDGTFGLVHQIPGTNGGLAVNTADFNHDGKLDLVYSAGNQLRIAFGDGTGNFTASTVLYTGTEDYETFPNVLVGDFDGDAKADIAVADEDGYSSRDGDFTPTLIFYGNGAGAFTRVDMSIAGGNRYVVADVNQDGKADLVGTYYYSFADHPGTGVHILYGSASRNMALVTLTDHDIYTDGIGEQAAITVADFNGDGRLDLATWGTDSTQDGYYKVAVFRQQADRTFAFPDKVAIATQSNDYITGILAADYDGDHKPDFAVTQGIAGILDVALNTSSGNFPTCAAPAKFGIHVCSPGAGTTVASPVTFNVAARSFSAIRKLEVWVDGAKRIERFFSYATDSYLNAPLTLANGAHHVTVYAVNFDGRLQRTSFILNVGSASGGTCAQPTTSTATVICSPANGSTTTNPVAVQARGGSAITWMEVWVDGSKRAQGSGNSITASLTLGAGSHQLTVFGKNSAGVLSKTVSDFVVH